MTDELNILIHYMPNGSPCPAVMTDTELISFLRLDASTGFRTLKYYRDEGQLVGIRLGKSVRYELREVLRFLNEKTEKNRNVG